MSVESIRRISPAHPSFGVSGSEPRRLSEYTIGDLLQVGIAFEWEKRKFRRRVELPKEMTFEEVGLVVEALRSALPTQSDKAEEQKEKTVRSSVDFIASVALEREDFETAQSICSWAEQTGDENWQTMGQRILDIMPAELPSGETPLQIF